MSTVNEPCAICRRENLETIIELPHYPLTDTLCRVMPEVIPSNYDQALLQCAGCGHIQLATFLQSDLLYGSHYHFRTGESAMARSGTAFFLEFLDHLAPRHNYRLIVDIGCNDLHCLASLESRATKRIGVDPIWKNRSAPPDDGILVVGKAVEDTNWDFLEGEKADLIICRHTLEHLRDPRSAVEQFLDRLSDDGVLILEVPGVEALIDKFRFDQIFHQHLHYFSAPILRRLIHTSGGTVIDETENWFNWGARLIAARKGHGKASDAGRDTTPCCKDIARRYSVFQRQMSTTIDLLQLLSEETTIVGYGAGQMLPVLSWHLGSDLGLLGCVLDDDRTKNGLHYANLPLTVRHPSGPADWENQAVMITAVDHAHSIVHKLHAFPPRHVVHPLCFL